MKILIIRLSSLGDIVLTEPFARELRRIYPAAEIDYTCKPQFVDIVRHFDTIDSIIPYDKTLAYHQAIAHRNYDMVYDLQTKFSSFLICLFAIPAKLSLYQSYRDRRRIIVRQHLKQGISSTVDSYLNALPSDQRPKPGTQTPAPVLSNVGRLEELLSDSSKLKVGIFPGAAHPTKMWEKESYAKLIEIAGDAYDLHLFGSNSEKGLCADIAAMTAQKAKDHCGAYDMPSLLKAVNSMDIVITNDSGPMHIAAALGKPQIAIFGATHPSLGFAPINPKAIVLSLDLDCQPCSLHGAERCPRGHFNCMRGISPEMVLSRLNELKSQFFSYR